MPFEFDAEKSRSNKKKHGIDFEQARRLWDDPLLLEIQARSTDEPRYLLIGRIEKQHRSAVVTYRNGAVRIISVRRARREEIQLYDEEN